MVQPVSVSIAFVGAMNEKFNSVPSPSGIDYKFFVTAGNKYDKVFTAMVNEEGTPVGGRSVHAFIDRQTGGLIKAATWNAPAKRKDKETGLKVDAVYAILTEENIEDVVATATRHGGYLYVR